MKLILVIEDSQDIQILIRILFEQEGYKVVCAGNGQEALTLLRSMKVRPTVIFVDLLMPVMGGAQFIQEMEKDPDLTSIPIVIMSGHRDAKTLGGNEKQRPVLSKPVDARDLLALAERYTSAEGGVEGQ